MTSPEFNALRELLAAEAARLLADIQAHREQLVEPASATGNSFIAGTEGADADADDERELALLQRSQRELDDVNAALRKLDSGRYGQCERCGETIAPARLQALPRARLCLECQRAAEQRQRPA
jgi:DnaK suppressor protein